MRKNSL